MITATAPTTSPVPVDDGIHQNVVDADYRRWASPGGVLRMSKSTLEYARPGDRRPSMARLKAGYDGLLSKDSAAFAFGRAFDTRLLEPDLYREQYAILPDGLPRKNSKAYVEVMTGWEEANPGREGISSSDAAMIESMAGSVMRHNAVKLIRDQGGEQASLAWTGPYDIQMRGRLDKLSTISGQPVIVDVKTCRDAADKTIQYAVTDYGYHRQAAIYGDGFHAITGERADFLFVFVSKEPPHEVRVERLDPELIDLGRAEVRECLRLWFKACEANEYPGAYSSIDHIEAPRWAIKRLETFGGIE